MSGTSQAISPLQNLAMLNCDRQTSPVTGAGNAAYPRGAVNPPRCAQNSSTSVAACAAMKLTGESMSTATLTAGPGASGRRPPVSAAPASGAVMRAPVRRTPDSRTDTAGVIMRMRNCITSHYGTSHER